MQIAPFDPSKKKKKKKVVIEDQADDSVDNLAKKTESLAGEIFKIKNLFTVCCLLFLMWNVVFAWLNFLIIAVSEGQDSSFTGLKKKKKKPIEASLLNEETGDVPEDAWDHEYEELLGRVYNILRENNPELAGDRRRTVMRPPQVLREGTKKTVFVNFMDLCKT